MPRYNHKKIEARWQNTWEQENVFKVNKKSKQKKYFVLEMFPYPSGRIHMGHVRNYTLGDVIARYKKACGFNVLHPMGWDAFGLPAENAAIENNLHPAIWTQENIKTTPGQLQGWYNQCKYIDDDKILTKSAHEHDDKALKLKKEVSNLIMAILVRMNESHQSTGGSKSKKRYHRRRTTIRKKKLRKAKSIKRRRKRGRKTRKNKK